MFNREMATVLEQYERFGCRDPVKELHADSRRSSPVLRRMDHQNFGGGEVFWFQKRRDARKLRIQPSGTRPPPPRLSDKTAAMRVSWLAIFAMFAGQGIGTRMFANGRPKHVMRERQPVQRQDARTNNAEHHRLAGPAGTSLPIPRPVQPRPYRRPTCRPCWRP